MAWDDFLKAEAWRNAMANLLKKGEEVGSYIEQAPGKAGQAILDAGQRQQALMNEAFDPTGKTLIRNPQVANKAAMNLLEGPLGFMPVGITAWHGSPHTFEKFDMSKVGTGEGAQAYGHGMYFAEAPQVASQYAKELGTKIDVNGKPLMEKGKIVGSTGNSELDDFLVANLGDVKATKKDLLQNIKEVRPTNPEGAKDYQKLLADLRKANVGTANTGNLYKVDIPDEHIPMMLDWDKPLHEQTPQVKKALETLVQNPNTLGEKPWTFKDAIETLEAAPHTREIPSLNLTGSEIYKMLGTSHKVGNKAKGQAEASEILNNLGIKGIRYKDQVSRNVDAPDIDYYEKGVEKLKKLYESKPTEVNKNALDDAMQKLESVKRSAKDITSNFVVFDPTDVKILERNNQPLTRKEILEEGFSKVNQPRKGTTKVDVPISMIEHGESALPGGRLTWPTAKETIKGYASKETPFPPIDLMGDASSKMPFMVVDGSHRLEAAKLRGDKTIPAYLDAEDLALFNSLLKK